MSDTDAQPDEFSLAEFRKNIAQAIVPAVATALLDPDRTGRQIKIIVYHQNLLGWNIEVSTDGRYRTSAFVHEGPGLEEADALVC